MMGDSPGVSMIGAQATREKFSVFEKHPDYVEKIQIWNYINDLYLGSASWLEITSRGVSPTNKTHQYIPRHPAETVENWIARINATYYDDVFARAINRFVDLLFRDAPQYSGEGGEDFFKDAQAINYAGMSADLFYVGLALSTMLYGHTFVLVDYPVVDDVITYADYVSNRMCPYWVEIAPQQLINWETEIINGVEKFKYAVIEEIFHESVGYGHELISQVRILKPGAWEIWRKREDGQEYLHDTGITSLDFVPLVPIYGSRFTTLATSKPLFKGLADKNRTLYQLTSDHLRKVSLCCNPTPVLKDQMRSPDEPLEIGPNSFVNLRDPNGSFTWEEPLALSIEQSRKTLEDLKASIDFESAQFLSNPSDRQSAAATGLMTNPVEATLATFSRFFAQGIETAIKYHCAYFGDDANVKVEFKYDIYPNQGKDSQAAFAIQGLFTAGLISRELALKSIQYMGFFPDNFNFEQEVISGRTERESRQQPATKTI